MFRFHMIQDGQDFLAPFHQGVFQLRDFFLKIQHHCHRILHGADISVRNLFLSNGAVILLMVSRRCSAWRV